MKTLSSLTGYSIATISKALHGSPVVRRETREAIFKAAARIGYTANARGVALRTGRTFQAAVLMPIASSADHEWNGVEYTQILDGINRALDGSPYRLAIHGVRDATDGCAVARHIVDFRLADGLVFSGIMADDPRIAFLADREFPFAVMGRCRKPLAYAHVDADNEWAAHAAAQRLIAGGHRRIALINPTSGLSYALDRRDGFRRALHEAGLPACDDLIAEGDLTARFGSQTVVRLRQTAAPPTGFICANEATTIGVFSGLRSLGLEPGRDASVIAYDDINVSAYLTPPPTTFFLPIGLLAQRLGEFLLRRMAGESPARLSEVFRPELIPRQRDALGSKPSSSVTEYQRRKP